MTLVAAAAAAAGPADAAPLKRATVTVRTLATVTAKHTATAAMTATVIATVADASIAPIRVSVSASATRSATATVTSAASKTVSARATTTRKATAMARARARTAASRIAQSNAAGRATAAATAKARAAAAAAARAAATQAAQDKARAQAAAAAPGATPTTGVVSVSPAVAPCGGQVMVDGNGRPMTCSFYDEFDGTTLDTTKWSPVTTASSGYRNNPDECTVDSPETIALSNGTLKLSTRPAPGYACSDHTTNFVSGSVSSIGKFSQAYGTYSIRAKFPKATVAGLHAALWMWPNDQSKYVSWPMSGEIDMVERYSRYNDRGIPYLHYVYNPSTVAVQSWSGSFTDGFSVSGNNIATNNYCIQPNPDDFHTYTMTWQPGRITIAFDGKNCITNNYSATNAPAGAPFDQPFFMILTQALGAAGTENAPTAATPKTATTEVDWVRVWK